MHLVGRSWPYVPPAQRTLEDAVDHVLEAASIALKCMARGRLVYLALTGGVDSRTVLAVALNAGVDLETYTYGNDKKTGLDQSVASEIAKIAGVKHATISQQVRDDATNTHLECSHFAPHHAKWVPALQRHYGNPSALAMTGNLLEIGGGNFGPARRAGVKPPISAESMAALHLRKAGAALRGKMGERHRAEHSSAFAHFIEETGYRYSVGRLDPFDQFYWEHRMSTWHGPAMNERDFYGEAFIPFNSREIFESMLGLPRPLRASNELLYALIRRVNSDLLKIPVNPSKWPL